MNCHIQTKLRIARHNRRLPHVAPEASNATSMRFPYTPLTLEDIWVFFQIARLDAAAPAPAPAAAALGGAGVAFAPAPAPAAARGGAGGAGGAAEAASSDNVGDFVGWVRLSDYLESGENEASKAVWLAAVVAMARELVPGGGELPSADDSSPDLRLVVGCYTTEREPTPAQLSVVQVMMVDDSNNARLGMGIVQAGGSTKYLGNLWVSSSDKVCDCGGRCLAMLIA